MTRLVVPRQIWKDAGTIKSQNDVIVKVIVPLLKQLGFTEAEMEFETTLSGPFFVQIGSKKVSVKRPDVLVKVDGKYVLVSEAKATDEEISTDAIGQAASYAVMFGAHFAMVSNGEAIELFRVQSLINYNQEEELLTKTQIMQQLAPTFTQAEADEAKRTLITFKERKEFANVFNTCHDIIRTQKGLAAKERLYEMCKILFVKLNEEDRFYKENQSNRFTRKTIDDLEKKGVEPKFYMNDSLFGDVKERLKGTCDGEEVSIFPKEEIISLESHTIKELVSELEKYTLRQTGEDIVGIAFETFLRGTMTGRELGEFFTPRELVDFMVELAAPKVNQTIIDPASGSGGFLIRAYKAVSKNIQSLPIDATEKGKYQDNLVKNCLWGIDIDHHLVKLAQANLVLHGDGFGHIYQHNSLLDAEVDLITKNKRFDFVLTNPPFGRGKGKEITDKAILDRYVLGRNRKKQSPQVLFLERCINLLNDGGWLFTVIDDGILSNSTLNYARKFLKDNTVIKAVISLPQGTFNPYGSGVKSSVLVAQKRKTGLSQGDILMAEARFVGYDTRRRTMYIQTDRNDLRLLINPYQKVIGA